MVKVLDFVQLGGADPYGIRKPSVVSLSVEKPCRLSPGGIGKPFSYQNLPSLTPISLTFLACPKPILEGNLVGTYSE